MKIIEKTSKKIVSDANIFQVIDMIKNFCRKFRASFFEKTEFEIKKEICLLFRKHIGGVEFTVSACRRKHLAEIEIVLFKICSVVPADFCCYVLPPPVLFSLALAAKATWTNIAAAKIL